MKPPSPSKPSIAEYEACRHFPLPSSANVEPPEVKPTNHPSRNTKYCHHFPLPSSTNDEPTEMRPPSSSTPSIAGYEAYRYFPLPSSANDEPPEMKPRNHPSRNMKYCHHFPLPSSTNDEPTEMQSPNHPSRDTKHAATSLSSPLPTTSHLR
ncbi:hypothetical protein BKA70DRAFT_1447795 [Coprinopsis sp. MPI-PUGE-AT-0042]|nr:hypothetical protein BKA70DRAFT_1447795 [Coprinopsis sp. MPI-PUGE-AT-0042]